LFVQEARILMASRWAQSEFREGSVERGRTIFFSLLDNYPKRIDVMVVFLDMEEKNKHWEAARELYRRATALHLSSKKMRYFLRRWLEFEKLHGDARDQQLVTDTAKAFVESRTKKDDSSE
jgi:rRNA biogenesis protein RRP5